MTDQGKKIEMGEECSTYVERRGAFRNLVEEPKERHYFECGGVYGRIILKRLFKI
jgi:hypothetical protein